MFTGKLTQTIIQSLGCRNIIDRNDFNLYPSQQKFLLWHCRLGHTSFQRVEILLGKPKVPHNSLSQGFIRKYIVVPSDHGASSWKPPLCEACQYAKQKEPPQSILYNIIIKSNLTSRNELT